MPVLVRYLLLMMVITMIREVQNVVYDQAVDNSHHDIDDIFNCSLAKISRRKSSEVSEFLKGLSFLGRNSKKTPCTLNAADVMLMIMPYLIIVTDATDAVSVNFSGRCNFLQI